MARVSNVKNATELLGENFHPVVCLADSSGNVVDPASSRDVLTRIENDLIKDTEEARYDITATDIYKGLNTDGASTSATTWTVVRIYLDGTGNPTRKRIRTNVAWTARTSGWT